MIQMLKSVLFILVLGSCSTLPSGPSVLVLPGTGKDFARFQEDDRLCRQYANQIITSASTHPDSEERAQQYYDNSYTQCMYAKDHLVPIAGELRYDSQQEEGYMPPPPPDMPPPQ